MKQRMQEIYETFSDEEKDMFWRELLVTMKWRGWDDQGKHKGIVHCHACNFIQLLDKLCLAHNSEIEQYT